MAFGKHINIKDLIFVGCICDFGRWNWQGFEIIPELDIYMRQQQLDMKNPNFKTCREACLAHRMQRNATKTFLNKVLHSETDRMDNSYNLQAIQIHAILLHGICGHFQKGHSVYVILEGLLVRCLQGS
mmetsp:Transcript_37850/g.64603  ORF Transcript_37850/g.64603 Transcript_37850/m.64603 type:complete len:128 (-) Transcript_37850:532-915(-)